MESLLDSNTLPFVGIYLIVRTFYFRGRKQQYFKPCKGQGFSPIVYSFDNRYSKYRIIPHIISVFCSFRQFTL